MAAGCDANEHKISLRVFRSTIARSPAHLETDSANDVDAQSASPEPPHFSGPGIPDRADLGCRTVVRANSLSI